MRILCRHGHFAFFAERADDLGRFSNFFGEELVRQDDFYTFPLLKNAPNYSIQGKPYLGIPATKTYEGKPWEVMRENGFVYHVLTGLLIPKASVLVSVDPPQSGFFLYMESPILQPGSRNKTGNQILSYSGNYVEKTFQLRLMEYSYE